MAKTKEEKIQSKKSFLQRKVVSKTVIKTPGKITLDLRQREEVPLKQHAFKEGEIGTHNTLFTS